MDTQPSSNATPANDPATKVGQADGPSMVDEAALRRQKIDEFEERGTATEDPDEAAVAMILADLFRSAIVLEQGVTLVTAGGGTAVERLTSVAPKIKTYLRVTREIARCAELTIAAEYGPDRRRKN